ncbi:MAG: hypothetical protein K6E47_05920 [Lachnospiraceae bacterium]|nr:hypothetical protein [Lachnospiraceae bacterium]
MKNSVKIAIGVVLVALAVAIFILSSDSYNYKGVARSQQEIYDLINTAVKSGKGEIYFETAINPNFLDLFTIMENATANGDYAGCEIYAMRYEYNYSPNGYTVHLHLSDPSRIESFLTEIRVKRIASKFEDLSDYEKIKGVHDYLVLLNRYVAFEGGAYSALFKGRSSCTGYAFAFYAIMRELGIDVTLEIGSAHAWNRVKLDGKWYNMDVTWDDNGVDEVSYNYFLKCDADWHGHHHGGSDAETSVYPTGLSAREYYGMVPNYILITEIIIILIFVIPVAVLGIILYKKKKKHAPIEAGKVMVAGSWNFLMPLEENGRFEVIRKMSAEPEKRDIWGFKDEGFFHETVVPGENINNDIQITLQQLIEEIDFIISVARTSNARKLCDALMLAKNVLMSGYTYGKYSEASSQFLFIGKG